MKLRWLAVTALVSMIGVAWPAGAQQQTLTPEERAERERQFQEGLRAPRPIEAVSSVWIDELTWMEVRDEIAAGKTTAIIPTGGVEQNGPYLTTGKHNVIMVGACEAIAGKLGNALCTPVVKFVPEGRIDPPSGHMRYPGTISLRQETYQALLDDIASSLVAHGFTDIIFLGDSGGNQSGMEAVANTLNARWSGSGATAYFIGGFYRPGYSETGRFTTEVLGIEQTEDDGLHDSFGVTALMMVTDPTAVRFDQRVKAGLAKINGVPITPLKATVDIAKRMMNFRADYTVTLIREAMDSSASQ